MVRSWGTQINRNERSYKNSRKPHQLLRRPEKIKSDRGNAFVSKEDKTFCKRKNIEIENNPPGLNTGTEAVERAIQTLKNLIIAN